MSALRLALLTAEHDVASFDCGSDQLTTWLIRHALASQRADLARTYLALDDEQVVAYVSLTTGSIRHDEAPRRYARGMPAAAAFYRKWGFVDVPENPLRLSRKVSDIRRSLRGA